MSRVKGGVTTRRRKKKIFKLAKGYWGKKKHSYVFATEAVDRAGNFAHRDRRAKKRDFRNLMIARINAAARQNEISYSKLINGLKKAKVLIDRKILSNLAISDANAFSQLVNLAKSQLSAT